ncbi:IQ calmodulin-binding motif family protein [Cryptosporidium muris RN66]|uniref:IQ calmodulin-binding motif family protein n=1 Tax=Cryptosporidium muris (strain RN66) TaxID=441375 RepID=B6AAI6_CRYMR|nr:IQ calmodulin-binding motif family protein [Cryptosporidium muris RN66]EEA05227.1 IQ calmodulin-binding motif family protein [Cryptosporidium muris RN66]|eukprot:XP_002139576.1 IQ calmodulin-binding motif family protein [Cryptosporidium muris RN66]
MSSNYSHLGKTQKIQYLSKGNNVLISNENISMNNEPFAYRMINYMASLIGIDNTNNRNPCLGLLSPISPIMLVNNIPTMTLPSPEPMIHPLPQTKNNRSYSSLNTISWSLPFGPKITPYSHPSLNNGLCIIPNDLHTPTTSNFYSPWEVYIGPTYKSPYIENINSGINNINYFNKNNKTICMNNRANIVNNRKYISNYKKTSEKFSRLKSQISPLTYSFTTSPILTNNNDNCIDESIELIVPPELAQALQFIVSYIVNNNFTNSKNINSPFSLTFHNNDKKTIIGRLNKAIMELAAITIQKYYRNYRGALLKKFIHSDLLCKYSVHKILSSIYKIQRSWRFFLLNNNIEKENLIQSVLNNRNKASSTIAAFWRGYKIRKEYDNLFRCLSIRWIWNINYNEQDNKDIFDILIRGSFTSKPWQEYITLKWDKEDECYKTIIHASKGIYYLQFIINNEIRTCGTMEIVVLPIVGVANKIQISDSNTSTCKLL